MPEQIFFENEPINCQYCQDGGPCTYCKRGQEEQAKIVEEEKKKPSGESIWEQIRRAKNGGKG